MLLNKLILSKFQIKYHFQLESFEKEQITTNFCVYSYVFKIPIKQVKELINIHRNMNEHLTF